MKISSMVLWHCLPDRLIASQLGILSKEVRIMKGKSVSLWHPDGTAVLLEAIGRRRRRSPLISSCLYDVK